MTLSSDYQVSSAAAEEEGEDGTRSACHAGANPPKGGLLTTQMYTHNCPPPSSVCEPHTRDQTVENNKCSVEVTWSEQSAASLCVKREKMAVPIKDFSGVTKPTL
jgi:hypothetical protein